MARLVEYLEPGPEGRQCDLPRQCDRRQGHNERGQVDPADEPSQSRGAGPAGPGVNPAANRVTARELGEAQRQAELSREHDRPRPEEGGAGFAIADMEVLHDAGEDRQIGEAGGEGGETAESATKLREVAGQR